MSEGLKITGDVIRVAPATFAPDGKPLEPEQAPAVRSITVESPLRFNTGAPIPGLPQAAMPGSFDYETTAGELAVAMRSRCATCAHFNVERWRAMRREMEWSADREKRAFVNEVRAAIEQTMPIGEREKHVDPTTQDFDIEHAIDAFGLCDAQTDIRSREEGVLFPVLMAAEAGCPDMKTPRGQDLSRLYKPRDKSAGRAADSAFDRIIRMAQGKRPE